jgi:DNA-binding CsgD family transcriptional regulator
VLSLTPESTALLERDAERAALVGALDDAGEGRGRLVVVEGEAGIGKSSILRLAATLAGDRRMRVLRATGNELERSYPYGVVRSLLEPLLRDPACRDLFNGPAGLAATAIAAAPHAGTPPADPLATLHGVHWLLLNLTERGPATILLDDAHWADEGSLRVASYLAHRIDELPALLVVGLRPTEAAVETEPGRLLRHHKGALHLRLAPLSEGAIGALMEVAGMHDPTPSLQHACWESTRGNPFLVEELLRDFSTEAIAEAATRGALDAALVPKRVADAIESRLAHLGSQARALAEAAAALGPQARLRLATRLAGLPEASASAIHRRLAEHAIVSDADPVTFIHPIVQGAIYASIPSAARQQLHRAAAQLLDEGHAPIEAVAVQLLSTSPAGDPMTVDWLSAAARAAVARGEPAVASTYLRRALDEPPSTETRPEILLELGAVAAAMGAPGAAAQHYRDALANLADPPRRAEACLGLGYALIAAADWAAACDAFLAGMDAIGGSAGPGAAEHGAAADLASRLDAGFIPAAWVSMSHRREAEARLAFRLDRPPTTAAERELAVWSAFQRGMEVSASAQEMGSLVDRSIGQIPIEELVVSGQTVELATGVLFQTDLLDEEIDLATRALEAIPRTGMYAKFGTWSYCRAWPLLLTARLAEALADTEAAIRAHEMGWEMFFPANAAVRGLALMERGELDAAEQAVTLDEARWAGRVDSAVLVPIARGRILLAKGDLEGAIENLATARQATDALGVRAQGPVDWRSWTAPALYLRGDRDEAQSVAVEGLEIARAWGAHWPLGVALRTMAMVTPGAEGIAFFQQAVDELRRSPATLELVRAEVELGASLRRAGSLSDARVHLAAALDLAHRHGALALRDRARAELLAAGARPRRMATSGIDSLTPAELRTARLAAAGRTNREVAQDLFITPKAIEYHLANVYRKLGIDSRRELAAALAVG